jgi:hypothetical protein
VAAAYADLSAAQAEIQQAQDHLFAIESQLANGAQSGSATGSGSGSASGSTSGTGSGSGSGSTSQEVAAAYADLSAAHTNVQMAQDQLFAIEAQLANGV